jgi:polyisoprenoid-binding protein YceI
METTAVDARTQWLIDQENCVIGFSVSHILSGCVVGSFKIFDAEIFTSSNRFNDVNINFWIQTNSLMTDNVKRDKHLKSPVVFDVENHPLIKFISDKVVISGPDQKHEISGDLTMMNITKNVKLEVRFCGLLHDIWGNERAGFSVTGKIKRSDWGLVWVNPAEFSGLIVSDEVFISCEVELIKPSRKRRTMQLKAEGENYGIA